MFRTVPVILLLAAIPASAAPLTQRSGNTSQQLHADDGRYAQELLSLVETIQQNYVRPVSRIDLLDAALTGLFEAARQPLPADLRKDLELLAKDERPELIEFIAVTRSKLTREAAVAGNRGILASANAMCRVLDAHCAVVSRIVGLDREGSAAELGIELDGENIIPMDSGRFPEPMGKLPYFPLRISEVTPGSPGQRAGLRPGDVITHLNGKKIGAAGVSAAALALLAQESSSDKDMTLTVERRGREQSLDVRVRKAMFFPESVFGVRRQRENTWDYWADRDAKIGYVRIGFIDSNTPENLGLALSEITRGGGKGLILDLRWCPGGYIDPATAVAAMFLKDGVIARVKYRNPRKGADESDYRAEDLPLSSHRAVSIPLLVLVNGETSGGGEMIAAALQDHQRAVVAGQRTVGKGSVQSHISAAALQGLSLKLTGGMLTRPNGKGLQRFSDSKPEDDWGIRPDQGRELPMTPDLSRHMKEQMILFALRPGKSREALPLDDPEYDTQRQAAVRTMRELLNGEAK